MLAAELPGGEAAQQHDERNVQPAPLTVREHMKQAEAAGYKLQALADGIPRRPHGLFPEGDTLLRQLAADPQLRPFEKHLSGEASPYEALPKGGWATGDAAAGRGVDLRLFYQGPQDGQQFGTIRGAVRLGDGAAIGDGFHMSAHGGAIETVLDEATAELAKLEFAPVVSTRSISFQLLRPVALHKSLLVVCGIKEVKGLRCYVTGAIQAAEGGPPLATCEAMLVDVRSFVE